MWYPFFSNEFLLNFFGTTEIPVSPLRLPSSIVFVICHRFSFKFLSFRDRINPSSYFWIKYSYSHKFLYYFLDKYFVVYFYHRTLLTIYIPFPIVFQSVRNLTHIRSHQYYYENDNEIISKRKYFNLKSYQQIWLMRTGSALTIDIIDIWNIWILKSFSNMCILKGNAYGVLKRNL